MIINRLLSNLNWHISDVIQDVAYLSHGVVVSTSSHTKYCRSFKYNSLKLLFSILQTVNSIVKPKRMSHRLVQLRIGNAVIRTILDATMANVYQNDGAVIMITVRIFYLPHIDTNQKRNSHCDTIQINNLID